MVVYQNGYCILRDDIPLPKRKPGDKMKYIHVSKFNRKFGKKKAKRAY